ncbi:MAG: methyltransferase domain-containing protein [Candidatus Jettenia sp.]|nr:methyltransferase domain-containing protein [Candidatus Jettenia sp.]
MYTDGDEVENTLLELFNSDSDEDELVKFAKKNWSFRYHLDPARQNLLNWYNLPAEGSVLEIGAGCGAITGLLCKRCKDVVAVELSERRANILRSRLKGQENLDVFTGNLESYPEGKKFDLVTSIGVLEYSGRFINTASPYLDFILMAKRFLKPGGELIIAIENRLGLKYWSGAPEDHTGRHFDGIENYPSNAGIRTFSYSELNSLVAQSGLKVEEVYFPLPDYKFPVEIFSSSYRPTPSHNLSPWVLQNYEGGRNEAPIRLFNERKAFETIIREDLFHVFSNSFLLVASNNNK